MSVIQEDNPVFTSLFDPAYEDKSIKEYEYIRIAPDCSEAEASVNAATNLVFRVFDKDSFYMPSEAKLEVRFRIVDEDGDEPANDTDISLINGGWNLFRQATYRLDENPIEDKNDVGIGYLVNSLVRYTPDYAQSIASNHFFYPDSGAGGIVRQPTTATSVYDVGPPIAVSTTTVDNFNYNAGFAKRRRLLNAGINHTIMLELKDAFGILRDSNKPTFGNTITFDLQRNTDYKRIIHADATGAFADARIIISRAILWIPRVRVSDTLMGSLLGKMAAGETTKLAFADFKVYDMACGTATDINWDVATLAAQPRRVYVAFQNDDKRTSVQHNGGLFDNAGVSRIWVELNGIRYPLREYQPTFGAAFGPASTDNYAREYMAFLEAGRKCNSGNCEVGSIVSMQDFKNLYTIYCFDTEAKDSSVFQNTTSTKITVRATVNGTNKHAYCVVESDRLITVQGVSRGLKFIL